MIFTCVSLAVQPWLLTPVPCYLLHVICVFRSQLASCDFFPMVKLIFSFFSQICWTCFWFCLHLEEVYKFFFCSWVILALTSSPEFFILFFCTCIVLFAPTTAKKLLSGSKRAVQFSEHCQLRWSDDPITTRHHLWAQLSSLLLPCDNSLAKLASAHLCEPLELLDDSVASHSKSVGEPLRDPQFIRESIRRERPCGEVTRLFIAANL